MRRIAIWFLLLLWPWAALSDGLYPKLDDPVDQAVQRLNIMSQRDEAFEGFEYNNGYLAGRGCQAVSLANAVIATFGVEDRETAADVVREAIGLLVLPGKQGSTRIELTRLPLLMDAQLRASQAEEYPALAKVIGGYDGKMLLPEQLEDLQIMEALMREMDGAFVLTSRMTVHPDWTAMVELVAQLEALGLTDARVCLSNVGVGSKDSDLPLSLGENGHYLTVMMHVGTFMREGRIYVLDSLPRALKGETYGYIEEIHKPYPFWSEYTAFRSVFDAARISPTVVRFSLADRAAWQAADEAEKSKMLAPMILFGPLVVMISCGEAQM